MDEAVRRGGAPCSGHSDASTLLSVDAREVSRSFTMGSFEMKQIFVIFFVLISSVSANGQTPDESALALCVSLAKGDIRDKNYAFSEESHFEEYKSKIKQLNLKEYKDLQGAAQKAGLDLPIAEGVIGLSAEGKSNSETFKKELNEFYNSTYSQKRDYLKTINSSSTLNSQLIKIIDNCNSNYFATLPNVVTVRVELVPQDYKLFQVQVIATIPPGLGKLKLVSVEPSAYLTCKAGGESLKLDTVYDTNSALFTCSKAESQSISFQILTNAGISSAIRVPAKPLPEPVAPTTPPPSPAVIQTEWVSTPPAIKTITQICTCLNPSPGDTYGEMQFKNVCMQDVEILAARDINYNGVIFVPIGQRNGRVFSRVKIAPKATAKVTNGPFGPGQLAIYPLTCPGSTGTPPTTRCIISPSLLPPGQSVSSCDAAQDSQLDSPCSCTGPGVFGGLTGTIGYFPKLGL